MDLLNCPTCYRITLADCFEKITVKAGLGAAETFFYRITDKFGNRYSGEVLTDEQGYFEISASDFVPAFFNPHAGTFELQVFKAVQNCEPETLSFCDVEYTCVRMDFAHEDSTEDLSEQIIPCECNEEEEEG